jgi:hypothetical protein
MFIPAVILTSTPCGQEVFPVLNGDTKGVPLMLLRKEEGGGRPSIGVLTHSELVQRSLASKP